MKKLDNLLARIPEIQARAKQRAEIEPLPGAPVPKNVVTLPLWPESVRAVPNGFLRSALFGAIRKGRRRYLKAEQLAALDGIEIRYTGERLDQGDLDVWESVLHAVRLQELGSQCRVTSYALLKLMGKTDTGKNRATLHERITRLRANAVEVRQGRYCYIGGLIAGAAKDEETQEWVIELDAKLRPLFAADQFTQVEWAVRHALDGQPLAQWLHSFYASHAKPFPVKIETLHRLCGLFGLWIMHLLERYGAPAGTVSGARLPGLAGLLGQVPPLRPLGLLLDVHEVAANVVAEPLAVRCAGLCHGVQRLAQLLPPAGRARVLTAAQLE